MVNLEVSHQEVNQEDHEVVPLVGQRRRVAQQGHGGARKAPGVCAPLPTQRSACSCTRPFSKLESWLKVHLRT